MHKVAKTNTAQSSILTPSPNCNNSVFTSFPPKFKKMSGDRHTTKSWHIFIYFDNIELYALLFNQT